jgi:purine-binding chemotaxis protein CheW
MTTPAGPAEVRAASHEMLLFRIGGEWFALPLDRAEAAVESLARDALPGMPAGMLGVARLRGGRLPVYSAERILGVAASAPESVTIVVQSASGRVGLLVDDVEDVIAVAPEARRPVPGAATDPVLVGVVPRGADLVGLCDPDALVRACLGVHA